jgi:signal transduction histidine kinase
LVAIIIVILWLFQIAFLDKFYSSLKIGGVKGNVENIVEKIEKLNGISQINGSEEIMGKLESYINEKQISVEVLDADYQVIYQGTSGSNMNVPGVMKESILVGAKKAMSGEESEQEVTHPKFGYKFMILCIPVIYENKVEGVMIVTMPMASIRETVEILKSQLIIITVILLLVALIISFKLSKNFADPILKISRQAESYEAGKYKMRIQDTRNDEIGKLAQRMNAMGEALARNDVFQKELIANVSHELRTPLTLIRGYAETLRDVTGGNPEKREKQLGVIIDESERLGIMVEDILNLAQLQSGTVVLVKEEFSLREMLQSIKEQYELSEEGNKLKLIGVEELKEPLAGDKNRIRQVFYNLIGNAFRHAGKKQLVEVVVTQMKTRIKIEVKDYGEGIANSDIDHVFERYYKGKRIDGQKSEGTGLGLSIVKSILEMHKAAYGVESKVGEGTTFWFELGKSGSYTIF